MNGFLWSAILGMFVATYSVRASFIVFGQLDVSATNPYLIGTLVAGLVAWKTRNVLIAVLISFAVFGLMRWLL